MAGRVLQRNYPNRGKGPHSGPFVVHLPLDMLSFDSELSTPRDDQVLTDLLLKYYASLSPSSEDQQVLSGLVARVSEILETLIVSPADFTAGQVEEVRSVGNFKHGTSLSGENVGELVIVLRTLPTQQAIEGLMALVKQRLTGQSSPYSAMDVQMQPYGFLVSTDSARVQVMITSVPANVKKSSSDVHIDIGLQKNALAAIRQTRWLEENASHTIVKVLTMILRDFRRRFLGFRHLSDWLINLLAHRAVLINPMHQALSVNQAFRHVLQLLAAGLLLPGSTGIIDPCELGIVRPHSFLTLVDQDELCCTAQTMLRILLHDMAPLLFTYNEVDNPNAREQLLLEASRGAGTSIVWSEPVIVGDEIPSGVADDGAPKPAPEADKTDA